MLHTSSSKSCGYNNTSQLARERSRATATEICQRVSKNDLQTVCQLGGHICQLDHHIHTNSIHITLWQNMNSNAYTMVSSGSPQIVSCMSLVTAVQRRSIAPCASSRYVPRTQATKEGKSGQVPAYASSTPTKRGAPNRFSPPPRSG